MSAESHIHVRPLEVADFGFVRSLASKQSNFTVPPLYVLWLLLRIKGSICLVADNNKYGPVAYLLAVPIEDAQKAIFVWQLASSQGQYREMPTLALLTELRRIVHRLRIRRVHFTSAPGSARHRAVRRNALRVFSAVPRMVSNLPASIDPDESEFLLNLSLTQPDASLPAASRRRS
jgi:hypothetical protein